MNLINFENCEPSGISYGGHSGSKKGVILNSERRFLNFLALSKINPQLSLFANSPSIINIVQNLVISSGIFLK